MGFLTDLLTLPILGPVRGIAWIARHVADQAERELYDADIVRGQLQDLELRHDLGEVDEQDYLAGEEALLARLKTIRELEAAQR